MEEKTPASKLLDSFPDIDAEALREVRERDEETGEKLRGGAVVLMKQLLERMGPDV